jgi:hypothetical protein
VERLDWGTQAALEWISHRFDSPVIVPSEFHCRHSMAMKTMMLLPPWSLILLETEQKILQSSFASPICSSCAASEVDSASSSEFEIFLDNQLSGSADKEIFRLF